MSESKFFHALYRMPTHPLTHADVGYGLVCNWNFDLDTVADFHIRVFICRYHAKRVRNLIFHSSIGLENCASMLTSDSVIGHDNACAGIRETSAARARRYAKGG